MLKRITLLLAILTVAGGCASTSVVAQEDEATGTETTTPTETKPADGGAEPECD